MWLLNSSIGKKLIMSISGLFLILFLVFHLCMNIAAVFSGEAYNVICGLLGSNWHALLGTLVLACRCSRALRVCYYLDSAES